MKIKCWNVNGIRSLRQYYPWNQTKDFQELIERLEADIICFQEVKAIEKQLPTEYNHVPGYDCFYHLCKNRAYSGVATLCSKAYTPIEVEFGLLGNSGMGEGTSKIGGYEGMYTLFGIDRLRELDAEGRVLVSDHQHFVLFNVYFPALTEDSRLDYKMDFSRAIQARIEGLLSLGRHVILVGDINVAHREIDHCDPLSSIKEHKLNSFQDLPPRKWFDDWLSKKEMIDVFRFFNPDCTGAFTCWNTLINARPANYGTRIDYILVSSGLQKWVKDAQIHQDVLGSDHCPISAELHDSIDDQVLLDLVKSDLKKPAAGCTYYWKDFAARQSKIDSFFKKPKKEMEISSGTVTFTNGINVSKVSKKVKTAQSVLAFARVSCQKTPSSTNGLTPSSSQTNSSQEDEFPVYDEKKF